LDHKHGDYLQDECHHDKEEDQNAEHLVLEALLSVVGHEKRETDEERLRSVLAFWLFGVSRKTEELTEPIVSNAFELR
jgi:hypothetical protein